MSKDSMRQSPRSIILNPNVRCQQVYPTPGSNRSLQTLQTFGIKMTREQAIHFARVLLAVTQDWEEIEITVYRLKQRKDGTHQITVTTRKTGKKRGNVVERKRRKKIVIDI